MSGTITIPSSAWEFRRDIRTNLVVYDRYAHDAAGAAVVYGSDRPDHSREFLVVINGLKCYVAWPDGASRYGGDHGNPLAVRIRWDHEWNWTLYAYFFNGDGQPHAEWDVQINV